MRSALLDRASISPAMRWCKAWLLGSGLVYREVPVSRVGRCIGTFSDELSGHLPCERGSDEVVAQIRLVHVGGNVRARHVGNRCVRYAGYVERRAEAVSANRLVVKVNVGERAGGNAVQRDRPGIGLEPAGQCLLG